ncbi:MAG TPA: glycosyl hydrolase, partial [Draconibacterium sp.]|nr:glycosyl hydrolase [Draconibacterium sp.]
AALKLKTFAEAGGKVVFIGKKPYRSLSFKNAEKSDSIVQEAIKNILNSESSFQVNAPEESADFVAWTKALMKKIELQPLVEISNPVSYLYTIKQYHGEQEIYFFVNSDRKRALEFDATFDTGNKIPNIWIPATGEQFALEYNEKNKLRIKLDALESALIVFEPEEIELPKYHFNSQPITTTEFNTIWDVKFEHINGTVFNRSMEQLIDFKNSDDDSVRTFAGTVTYTGTFENIDKVKYIKLLEVNQAVTEFAINGKFVGMLWYGNHTYDISSFLKKGSNKIEIKLTTTLANYCRSLTDNPTAQAWTRNYKTPFSSGLEGVAFAE